MGKARERECRLCGGEIESWKHVLERCRSWTEGGGNWQEVCGRMLGGEGEGKKWLREVETERRRIKGRGEKWDGRGGLRKVSRMIDKNGRVNGGNGSPEGG